MDTGPNCLRGNSCFQRRQGSRVPAGGWDPPKRRQVFTENPRLVRPPCQPTTLPQAFVCRPPDHHAPAGAGGVPAYRRPRVQGRLDGVGPRADPSRGHTVGACGTRGSHTLSGGKCGAGAWAVAAPRPPLRCRLSRGVSQPVPPRGRSRSLGRRAVHSAAHVPLPWGRLTPPPARSAFTYTGLAGLVHDVYLN